MVMTYDHKLAGLAMQARPVVVRRSWIVPAGLYRQIEPSPGRLRKQPTGSGRTGLRSKG